MWKRCCLIILIIISVDFSVSAQADHPVNYQKYQGKSVRTALKSINKKTGIRFAYDPAAMSGIIVEVFNEPIESLEEFLSFALQETRYAYKMVSGTYVIFPETSESASATPKRNFSLQGLVRDAKTGETLPYANIRINGSSIFTTSNSDGKFTLLKIPSDSSMIVISYLGYQNLRMSLLGLNTDEPVTFELHTNQRYLPSVEITEQNVELLEINRQVGQFTFNPNQISKLPNLGENDLFASLRWLSGVNASGEAQQGLRIRGSKSDQTLVSFDGFTVYHVDHLFGMFSAFNANAVKNIQLYKGGFEAKYGSRSAGVLNITGIDGNTQDPGLLVEANLLSANLVLELPIVKDKASLMVAYRRAYTNIIQSPPYQKIFNNVFNSSISSNSSNQTDAFSGETDPDFYFYDTNVKFNFNPTDKDAIALSYYEGRDNLNINFLYESGGISQSSQDESVWGNNGGSVKWSRQWNKKFFSYANFGTSRYSSMLAAEESVFLNSGELFARRFIDQRTVLYDHTLRIDNSYQLNGNNRLEFGAWHSVQQISLQAQDQDNIYADSLQSGALSSLYAQNTTQLGKWRFNYGLRGSYYNRMQKMYIQPRLSINYQYNPALTLKGAYGIYYQMIHKLNEQSLYLSIPETWALSDDTTIPVLKSIHYIAGAVWSKNNFEADLEVFTKMETGTVDFLYPEFGYSTGDLDQYATGGNRRIVGLDLLLKKKIRKHNGWLTYTFMSSQSRYPGINNNEYFASNNDVRHEVHLVYLYELKRWDFSAAFVAATGTPYTPIEGTFTVTMGNGEEQQYISLGTLNSQRTQLYDRLDLSATYTIPLKNGVIETGISCYNLYNSKNIKFIDYFAIPENEGNTYTVGKREIYSLGLTPSLFVKLRL